MILLPVTGIIGQEKKNEEKIKIVKVDDSGSMVVIDTIFKDGSRPDTIRIKDGKIVFAGHKSAKGQHLHGMEKGSIIVMPSADDRKNGKESREITVIYSDSIGFKANPEAGSDKVIIYSGADHQETMSGDNVKVIKRIEKGGKGYGQSYIYINDDKDIQEDTDEIFDVHVDSDQNDLNINRTKYVIAKNGIVVSVEGDDEAKVKEIINMIETKLDVNKDGTDTKSDVKEIEKKQVKKK